MRTEPPRKRAVDAEVDEEAPPPEPARARERRRGTAFVYVLPCVHEDILKLGHSRDPLRRMRTFQRRYFDFFDLDAAFLVQTDRVAEALGLERQLGLAIAEHRAPQPVRVPRRAAGFTEWYRGALPLLEAACRKLADEQGYPVLALRPWLNANMRERAEQAFAWSQLQYEAMRAAALAGDAALARAIAGVLGDALDEFAAAHIEMDMRLPAAVVAWNAARPSSS